MNHTIEFQTDSIHQLSIVQVFELSMLVDRVGEVCERLKLLGELERADEADYIHLIWMRKVQKAKRAPKNSSLLASFEHVGC